jgi:hypothetical protein
MHALFAILVSLTWTGPWALADATSDAEANAAAQASISAIKQTAPVGAPYVAKGVQIYTCTAEGKWDPKAARPVAALFDSNGNLVGIHYARRDCGCSPVASKGNCSVTDPTHGKTSPAWEFGDGGQVVAKSKVSLPNPGTSEIEGQTSGNVATLNVTLGNTQNGSDFPQSEAAGATHVVREAQGGAPPDGPCTPNSTISRPYRAIYSFYNASGNAPSAPAGSTPSGAGKAAGARDSSQ